MGFHSGPKKLGDQFSETFHGLGTAIYASDSVDPESTTTLIMTGSVVVGLPEDQDLEVMVLYGEVINALYTPDNSTNDFIPVDICPEGTNSGVGPENATQLQFRVSQALTPVVSNIQQDSGSIVTVSKNRGHFQGTNTPSFEISGSGFGSDSSCQNQIMVGSSSCSITNFDETSITCSVTNPLASETSHPLMVLRSNHGYGVMNDMKFAKYFAVSSVSSISPIEGSKGGGNTLTVSGSGFISQDGSATVVFVGPDQVRDE